jgi:hypothetical protein
MPEHPLDGAGEPATLSRQEHPPAVPAPTVVPEPVISCDNCGKPLVLGRATCVTNATDHLHADFPECVRKLEQRLGTFVG